MNFKKYYINGNRFTIEINFRTEMHWNDFMYWLTQKTTAKPPISELIYNEMVKNPPELELIKDEPSISEPTTFDSREIEWNRRHLIKTSPILNTPEVDPKKQKEIIRKKLSK